MVAVNVVDGIKYGFRLLGYLLAVVIVAFILAAIGGAFMPGPFGTGGNIILAGLFYLAAFTVYAAGFLGLLYKVIADGVETGTLSAERGGGLGNVRGGFGGGNHGGANRQYANQARQGAETTQNGGQQSQPGAGQTQHGGQQSPQGGQGGDHGQAQDQRPPQDWEPGR